MPTKDLHRRFRFSLRTLFVVVTVVGIATSWSVQNLSWIGERHAFIRNSKFNPPTYFRRSLRAPGMLWLFGESGVEYIGTAQRYETAAKRLFPEAQIVIMPGWERTVEEMMQVNTTVPGYYVPSPYDQ